MRGHRSFIALLAMALVPQVLNAQDYPVKPVRIIVPVGPGGATDILTRALAQRLATVWNQQVVVDNRPGGGSNIGFEVAARAPADGYTLLMAQPAFTVNVSLYKKLAYEPLRDFSPITLAATSANVLVVHPSVPARSLQELIALAKARPGQLSYGSAGNGTTPHLSGELFKSMSGIDIQHIPYKGGGQAVANVLGGHVDMAFSSLASLAPQIKAQRLRALAVTSPKRSALMPNLPTFGEAGLAGFSVTGWFGVVAPSGIQSEIVARLHTDITRSLNEPELMKALVSAGVEPATSQTPREFAAFLQAEIEKWAKVVKASGATVQ
jgi:tripartite-type tricarboxylate transporter receptor subunit TctC